MRPIATDVAHSVVVCLSVSVGRTSVLCKKTTEPIEMPFAGLKLVDTRNHVLDGGSKSRHEKGGAILGVVRPVEKHW